jgi:hypothetical protein
MFGSFMCFFEGVPNYLGNLDVLDLVEFLGTQGSRDDSCCLHVTVEVLLMLECEGFSFGGGCHTYNHNLPKRRVKPVEVNLHVISPFGIIFPIEMRRLSQMYGIEFLVRVVARNLCVVVGHFIEAGLSVLGLLLLDHLLEELLGHLLGLLLFSLSFLFRRLLCRTIIILNVFIT